MSRQLAALKAADARYEAAQVERRKVIYQRHQEIAGIQVLGGDGPLGFTGEVIVDVLEPFDGQGGTSLAIGAGFERRGGLIELKTPGLGLADGGAIERGRRGRREISDEI